MIIGVPKEIMPEEGAALLEPFADDSFFVVSSDLSHFFPYESAVARDRKTIGLIESLDAARFVAEGDACGKSGIAIIMALCKKKGWGIKSLRYANSGDTAGPKDEVVGYAAMAIVEEG
jgi:AmmeMemoRadiSam system protein B